MRVVPQYCSLCFSFFDKLITITKDTLVVYSHNLLNRCIKIIL